MSSKARRSRDHAGVPDIAVREAGVLLTKKSTNKEKNPQTGAKSREPNMFWVKHRQRTSAPQGEEPTRRKRKRIPMI